MKYSQLIEKRKQYKYSANICFDLENENRLSGFIPNVTTTEILREYLYGIIQKGDTHSRILYGSYGTGKSHLLTVLSALLGHINTDGKAFDIFINAIEHYDKEFAKDIKAYVNNDKPYLVVPIYSDFSDFDRCISFSLKKEMGKLGYEICFKNYFHEALVLLENWEQGEDSSLRLNQILCDLKIDMNKLKNSLANFETLSEKMFDEVFKMMTYGASFVSGVGNLIDNLNQANQTIIDDYRGIVFVFDEFGRYIEDNSESIKVKTIQDFAEYCDHTDYDNHLILVSHKQLSLYTDKMKKSLSDEWKKIEGRFKSTSINIKYDQCLSLIPHIIPKTKKWEDFRNKYSEELNCLYEQAWDFKGFLLPPEGGNPFEGGYPLHPITLYALDRLSKKVAQNERTFFTYLASDEKNSLFSQLKNLKDDRFHFVGLDYIYDYFEENIMSFRANDIYLVYKKLQYAINKLGDMQNSIEVRILKAMAVINIISDTAILSSNRNTLCHVIDENDADVIRAIEELEQKKIIKYMRQYGFYDFLDSSIYDFDSLIEERIPAISDEMVTATLNDEFSCFAIYPNDYNFTYHMNRIFAPVFAYRADISKKTFLKSLPAYYDGIVAFILDRNYMIEEYAVDAGIPERTICLVNTVPQTIENEVKRYISVKYYYAKREELKKDDPTVKKELLLYLEEEKAIVNDLIESWKNMVDKNIVSIVYGEERNISSALELTKIASDVVEKAFPRTIIVNNDLVNKNAISGAIKLARAKALEYIMGDEDDILKECTLLSPEHTIIRSVLVKNGLYDDETNATLNVLPDGEYSGRAVQKEIRDYLKKTQKAPVPLMEIYKKLKQPPYGLRDGYLPILLAFEMKKHENVSISFHGADRDYCIDELIKAFESPEDFSIYICNWDRQQREFIERTEALFGGYRNSKSKSRLKDLLNAMNTHFAGVSKSARTTEKFVTAKTKLYRDIMSVSYKDYNAFFFEILPQINRDLSELSYELEVIKNELENVSKLQLAEADRIIRNIFEIADTISIVNYFAKKYEDDWSQKEHKVFDYQTNAMIEYLKTFNRGNEDNIFIEELAQVITGFEIGYWNDSKMDDFNDTLLRIIYQLENFEVKEGLEDNEVKIIIQAGNENLRSTQFDKQELSGNGQVMFNKMKSTLENFGQSLSQEEKNADCCKAIGRDNVDEWRVYMIFWCDKCQEPIFDKELHKHSCKGTIKKISDGTICNPVFLQERKLLSCICGEDLSNKKIWYFGASKYYYEGQLKKIPYRDWYKGKKHLLFAEELRENIAIESDYTVYMGVVEANLSYVKNLVYEAENYITNIMNQYKAAHYIPTVSFSGGKDSTVVSRLVRDALQDNSVLHFFGDTTLEFKETYDYVRNKFRKENPLVPMLPSETENDFFKLCKVFGPPSQHERWCCTIFKTSNLNKELDNLPGNSLSFLGIRHSESLARKSYERTQEHSKISSQINAMPIIEWTDYDVWLYILYRDILVNDCYQYGYKRVGCWCCPNNSDWSMMLTEIYHPEDMQRWKDMIYDFARKTGKTDIDDYYDEGRWRTRRGASGLQVKNVSIVDTVCNLSDRARNIIIEKKLNKDVVEFFKPLGDLKIVEKADATYISVFDVDKSDVYRKCFELIISFGTNVVKVLPEERIDITNLVNRIKCQLRKYQFCIRCSACDSVCPHGAIDTIHGTYHIDESRCVHCKKCVAKFYNGCIICDKVAGKKEDKDD